MDASASATAVLTTKASSTGSALSTHVQEFSMDKIITLIESNEIIGEGSFGIVYKSLLNGKTEVAVKCLKEERRLEACRDSESQRLCDVSFSREIEIISKFDHPNIVKLYGWAKGPECRIAMVFELCPDGTLYHALSTDCKNAPNAPWLLGVAIGVARGLVHMHGITIDDKLDSCSSARSCNGVVLHRDVKSLNIGLCGGIAKLIDCGSSRNYDQNPDMSFSLVSCSRNALGTLGYIADEVANGDGYGVCSEIFSFGVVLLEMLTSRRAKGLVKCVKRALIRKEELLPEFISIFQSSLLDKRVLWHDEVLEPVLRLALLCVEGEAEDRPSNMRIVLTKLCNALDSQHFYYPQETSPGGNVNFSLSPTGSQIDFLALIENQQQQISDLQSQMKGLFDVCIRCANKFPKGLGLVCAERHAMCPVCSDMYVADFMLHGISRGRRSGDGNISPLACDYRSSSLCSAAEFSTAQVCHGCPLKGADYIQFLSADMTAAVKYGSDVGVDDDKFDNISDNPGSVAWDHAISRTTGAERSGNDRREYNLRDDLLSTKCVKTVKPKGVSPKEDILALASKKIERRDDKHRELDILNGEKMGILSYIVGSNTDSGFP